MFDISWTEFLVVGVVALLVVGPKELPALLRTLGKYTSMVRKQANEFRAQFDEAMREAEIDKIKQDVESVGREMETSVRSAEASFQSELDSAKRELDAASTLGQPEPPRPPADPTQSALHDADGLPITTPATATPEPNAAGLNGIAVNGAGHAPSPSSGEPAAAPITKAS